MAYEEILTKSTGVSLVANQGLSDEEKLNAITNIGLGNVDNTSDANKPVSTAQQTALNKKVDKVTGKGLSTNDYTTAEKNKLKDIAEGAQVNVIEEIQVNGAKVTPSGKAVDISVPTGALSAKDKVAKTDLADALKTEIEGKVNTSDCGDILASNKADFAAAGHTHDIKDLTQSEYIVFNCGSSSTVI